jgi:hypothetical protein
MRGNDAELRFVGYPRFVMTALPPSWRDYVTCVDLTQQLCRLASCRAPLEGRRTAYCSDKHANEFQRNHVWADARRYARRRAKWACERCGFKPNEIKKDPERRLIYTRHELRLEVNHIQPLGGRYRGVTCLNHQENLEVLCHRCHVRATGAVRLVTVKAATPSSNGPAPRLPRPRRSEEARPLPRRSATAPLPGGEGRTLEP